MDNSASPESSTSPGLLVLTPDALWAVLSWLPAQDLCNAGRTCKTLSQLSFEVFLPPLLWDSQIPFPPTLRATWRHHAELPIRRVGRTPAMSCTCTQDSLWQSHVRAWCRSPAAAAAGLSAASASHLQALFGLPTYRHLYQVSLRLLAVPPVPPEARERSGLRVSRR